MPLAGRAVIDVGDSSHDRYRLVVGGLMNPLWMALATIIMAVEKLPQIGRYVTRPLGAALIVAGAGVAISALV